LEQERNSPKPDEDLINDLLEAIGYVFEDFGPSIDNIDSLLSKGETTFEYLWALFRPGTIIFTEVPHLEGVPQVLLLRNGNYVKKSMLKEESFTMHCWTLSHDGICLGLSAPMYAISLEKFLGSRPITDLPIFPFEHHPNRDSLRAALIRQGREFLTLLKPSYREYRGPAIMEKYESLQEKHELRKFIVCACIFSIFNS
jgi:hypothetical protein